MWRTAPKPRGVDLQDDRGTRWVRFRLRHRELDRAVVGKMHQDLETVILRSIQPGFTDFSHGDMFLCDKNLSTFGWGRARAHQKG